MVLEFLHVVTDARRFEVSLSMAEAAEVVAEIWNSPDVDRIPAASLKRRIYAYPTFSSDIKNLL